MRRHSLPIEQLSAWSHLNGVQLLNAAICPAIKGPRGTSRGNGLVLNPSTPSGGEEDRVLLSVPHDLILSKDLVEQYAKSDSHLRNLLEAVGNFAQSARGVFLVFLLLQITHISPDIGGERIGVANPWTDYVAFLPQHVLLPTFYNEEEKAMLEGTSLKDALQQKLVSLEREFEGFKEATKGIAWCEKYWWDEDTGCLSFDDWKYVDAIYRSRGLDLPRIGHAMVPVLDLANHSSDDGSNARFEVDSTGNALLVLQDGKNPSKDEEITIQYGVGGLCEMLFSYGFLDDGATSAREMFLTLDIPSDDPLRGAKLVVSGEAPGVRIYIDNTGNVRWESGFLWWVCMNEEDGLNFEVLRANDGGTEMQAMWKDKELDPSQLPTILSSDPLWEVFQLRATIFLQERVGDQGEDLEGSSEHLHQLVKHPSIRESVLTSSQKLRDLELELLTTIYNSLEDKKAALLDSDLVQTYLANHSPHWPDQDRTEASQMDDFR